MKCLWFFFLISYNYVYWFYRERHRLVAPFMCPDRDGTHHLGLCPYWELTPQHFNVCDDAPTTWATWPGLKLFLQFCQVFFHALQNTSSKYFRWVYNKVHLWIQEVVIEKDRPCPWLQTNIVKPWPPAPTRLQTRRSFPLQMTQGTKGWIQGAQPTGLLYSRPFYLALEYWNKLVF